MMSQNQLYSYKAELAFIMPAKNEERYLSEAIESFLYSKNEHHKLVIIDDFSTDRTADIAIQYQKDNPTRIIFKRNKISGKVNALNLGIKLINASYYKFIDADDILEISFWAYFETIKESQKSHTNAINIARDDLEFISKWTMPSLNQIKYKSYIENITLLPKASWTFFHDDIKGLFPIPKGMPYEDIWFSFYIFFNDIKIINSNNGHYRYRQHDSQTFGNTNDISEEKILFRFRRVMHAIQIISGTKYFYVYSNEIQYAENIAKFMIGDISIYSFYSTTRFDTFLKHLILRDYKSIYLFIRRFLWSVRNLRSLK